MSATLPARPIGALLRDWRQRRRLSQLDLAGDADISTRHLSCVETGRALPSREMVLRLAERLDVPLRERNRLLTAAGYAPMFAERRWTIRRWPPRAQAVELVLEGHEPYPALAVDRHWTLVVAQPRWCRCCWPACRAELLQPPVNVLRLSLHPQGLAPRIVNLRAVARAPVRAPAPADRRPAATRCWPRCSRSCAAYPLPPAATAPRPAGRRRRRGRAAAARTPAGVLSFISTTTVFGTPVDITLSELALETFFPADEATALALRRARRGAPAGRRADQAPTTA